MAILDTENYAASIKALRKEHMKLTQQEFAGLIDVSYVTVNRWENGQARPSKLLWEKLLILEKQKRMAPQGDTSGSIEQVCLPILGFASTSQKVRVAIEAERLASAHSVNPAFATEISRIDPLPHQRIAVYDHMLKQDVLRFLLADDAGAGKTIMCGLYIQEMLSRKRLRRILIIPPAGLVGNWRNELEHLFQLSATIINGSMLRTGNPFIEYDFVICSIDTLRGRNAMSKLAEAPAYDLVVFDEAHKLSCDRGGDMRVRESERYKAAAAIAGADGHKPAAKRPLPWHATHLLLLTATPHMGKEYPYFALWRLLEPHLFSTPEAFEMVTPEIRAAHFIRRTKEEMVTFTGKPLYPMRCSSTLSYQLSESEQELYDATTDYLLYIYNKAKILNRSASRLALAVFQRRLASSTWALLCSLERRVQKIDNVIFDIERNKISEEQLLRLQTDDNEDLYSRPTDETDPADGREQDEIDEDRALSSMVATCLGDLQYERTQVLDLVQKAKAIHAAGTESKFDMLRGVLDSPEYGNEKLLLFTEHKDTVDFLTHRLEALGYTGKIAYIHGGLDYEQRQKQIAFFRKEDGARIMLCTDAAAEGVNLQFCWIMLNYDIPWNPARLEQRMGRIHRYGQKHDPVFLLNLVASNTREGCVLTTLLEKLEAIRKQLNSDKVFDSIGRVFNEVSITEWMRRAMLAARSGESMEAVGRELNGVLTEEQVLAVDAQEKSLYGDGGDVKVVLPQLRKAMDNEYLRRLLPGYTQAWLESAAPLLGLAIDGELDGIFRLRSSSSLTLAIDHTKLWDAINLQSKVNNPWLSLRKDVGDEPSIWVHPGEPVFEALRQITYNTLHSEALSGAVFQDAETDEPYLLHVARLRVVRRQENTSEKVLEERLVGIRYSENNGMTFCPVERLLVVEDVDGVSYTSSARILAGKVTHLQGQLEIFLKQATQSMVDEHTAREQESLPTRRQQLLQGLRFESASLARTMARLRTQQRQGSPDPDIDRSMEYIRERMANVETRRQSLLDFLTHEPERIQAGNVEILGHALVIPAPTQSDSSFERLDAELLCPPIEAIAMRAAIAWEGQFGKVIPVHTPERARAAGLSDYPGYDLLSLRDAENDGKRRCIEVKGTSGRGDVHLSANELARAITLGDEYWLYVVYNCATSAPHLSRLQNPYEKLILRPYLNSSMRHSVTMNQILELGEE